VNEVRGIYWPKMIQEEQDDVGGMEAELNRIKPLRRELKIHWM
jgi:hypothetical protein